MNCCSSQFSTTPVIIDEAPKNSDQVLVQLRRIRGQLDGLISMYEDERTCIDIVRQVIAARNSLSRVARDLLTGEATRCTKERRLEDLDELLKELFRN
ncbi:MAG TPA: transcriptional regulator [Candidatus Pacebacteria bacterium]|nr:transcriptional regulator [Candidatus Paceibacterota bacterium]